MFCAACSIPTGLIWQASIIKSAIYSYILHGSLLHNLLCRKGVLHLAGGLKDVGLIQSLAKECGVQMPLGNLMLDHLKEAGDRGWTDLDWTAVTRVIREPAGIHEED
jgi:3-hydroxyisobutyrate dehydrogenase-like beta-hydroxyacid dehydrogenase